jgi:glutamate-1-semialdehyde 2,1-aminomutase
MGTRPYILHNSVSLFERAAKVIPGGAYGTKSPGFVVPGSFPYFFTHGKGACLFDVDGNQYIDYMCGYGSMILGYGNPVVDEPAIEQLRGGDLLTQPGPVIVELAERLVDQIQGMSWAVFAKNGTDATSLAVSLARVQTDRQVILVADGAYHGSANWCSSNCFPVLGEQEHVVEFPYNDIPALQRVFAEHAGNVAAVVLTPYHHCAFGHSVMPSPQWYPAVEQLCRDSRALFIMDDIRANFRLNRAGSHVHFGCSPDLIAMGKSIANGYPLSVLMGTEAHRKVASSFFITGTFWTSTVPMIAALAALAEMDRIGAIDYMNSVGRRLASGLSSVGAEAGFRVSLSGPPAIPFMMFDDDPDLWLNQRFCAEMTKRGAYLHPHHNWYLSCAHTEEHIDRTIEMARECFRLVSRGIE